LMQIALGVECAADRRHGTNRGIRHQLNLRTRCAEESLRRIQDKPWERFSEVLHQVARHVLPGPPQATRKAPWRPIGPSSCSASSPGRL
jgi:hypothetical protein